MDERLDLFLAGLEASRRIEREQQRVAKAELARDRRSRAGVAARRRQREATDG